MHRFVLQAIDPDLGCSVLETMLHVADIEALRPLLGECAAKDKEIDRIYFLDADELRAITERFGVAFAPGDRECWLSRVHSIQKVPYLVHTGYELALMLDGVKPLSWFSVEYPGEPLWFPEEALFEPHVASGRLVKRTMAGMPFERPIRLRSGRVIEGTRHILYARRGEEWRIDAHALLMRQFEHGPWNETLERLHGSLLGYTDEQNDWWQARRRRNSATSTYTDETAYAAVTAADLAWVRSIGERALPLDGPPAGLELVLHDMLPDPAVLERWIADADAAAIVRFGLARTFLEDRKRIQRHGAPGYLIARGDVPALNRALTSGLTVVAER